MGQRTNKSCRSAISITPQPLLQDTDRDAFFLPGNDQIYLTHNKAGKPALGRNKSSNILQDFGFDILGQSFGVPSRKDYEQQARPLSLASQSSGLITTPVTPRPSQDAQMLNDSRQVYRHENPKSPVIHRKTSSIRSSSTPAPTMVDYSNQNVSNSHQNNASRTNSSFIGPQASGQQYIPPPPPPPPPSAVSWHRHPIVSSSVAHVPMNYYGAASLPTYLPGYSYNGAPMSQGAQNWANPQHNMAAQYPNALGTTVPQTAAIPTMLPHQQFNQSQPAPIPYVQAIPTVRPFNMPPPPPPPPPPQSLFQACAMTTRQGEVSQQGENCVGDAKRIVKQGYQARNSSRDAIQAHEKLRCGDDVKEYLSKRIRHVHVCGGCGKKRSTRYQKAHPLKRGEVPALNYCYNCLKDAADTDGDRSDGDVAGDSSLKKDRGEANVPWPSSNERRAIADGKHMFKNSRDGPRQLKKPNRFGLFSRLFSRKASPSSFPPPPKSFSSVEESSSRASSPVSDLYRVHGVPKIPVSRGRRPRGKRNSRTVQERAKTPALHVQRHSSVDSWIATQNSPLIPDEKELHRANGGSKVRTASNNPSTPTQLRTRTRITRPQPQSTLVGSENPFLDADDRSASVSDGEHSSPYLDTSGATGISPMSQSAGMGVVSEPLNQMIPNEIHKTAKRINTNCDVNEGTKSGAPSSKTDNPTNASSSAQSPHLKASVNETPVEVAPKAIPTRKPVESTDHSVHGPRSAVPEISLDYNPGINLEQASMFYPVSTAENNVRWSVGGDDARVASDEPELLFSYAEPLTPTDVPCARHTHSPHVASELWSDYHTDIEREAEEMAERDLAFAGKLFDSLSGSLGGSATSTFPTTSFVTRSNISIVSCDSDSDYSENNTTTPSIKEAEVEEAVEGTEANKPVGRIEFSSEEEQENWAKSKALTEPSIAYLKHQDRRMTNPSTPERNMYNQPNDGYDDDDDTSYPLSPVGSSLIGHTGHSVDELDDYTPAISASGHRLRRFMWLPSA
ncbi:hypothetical protein F4803DRAFT_574705 [Xylaria telfairii]|nr:hypothetical protein F4803DRAFT_574705 [Xylaria telfairii]